MNNKNRKICRLCLKVICGGDFDVIEEISRHMLEVLLLNMFLEISKEPVMCSECATNLQRSFDFKSFCLNTENTLQSFSTSVEEIKLSLIDVYLRENRSNSADVLEDQKICRICIEPIETGCFIDLHETKEDIFVLDILRNQIPEVDLNITEEPVICKTCHQSFQHLHSFIKNCYKVEETINRYVKINGADGKGQIDLNNLQNSNLISQSNPDDCKDMQLQSVEVVLKTEIKNEDCMETDHLELTVNQEEIENISEQDYSESLQESPPDTAITDVHKCTECEFETKYRHNLITHLVIHKDPLELTVHKCQFCTYETRYIRNIRRHMIAHKKPTEVKMHRCTICTFSTKYRPSFNLHLLTHKKTSEVVMSKCTICTFETKYKKNLKRHMMIHKSGTKKESTYECESCTFKTNYKLNLKDHVLSHKELLQAIVKCEKCGCETNDEHVCYSHQAGEDPLKTQLETNADKMYKCALCPYETDNKTYLRKHVIRHKNPSELTMHTCEVCSYQSKRKDVVERHSLIHKTSSEVTMYKCMTCLFETKYKNVLKSHVLIHQLPQKGEDKLEFVDVSLESDIEMFKCDTCAYKSKYKADVKKHVLIHMKPSEVTMYRCKICVYETKFKSAFNRHLLIHRDPSEVVIYKCEFCPRRTKYKTKIDKHMLTHYNSGLL